ncbi:unnamed protein product, partial [Urochloa humidicola]
CHKYNHHRYAPARLFPRPLSPYTPTSLLCRLAPLPSPSLSSSALRLCTAQVQQERAIHPSMAPFPASAAHLQQQEILAHDDGRARPEMVMMGQLGRLVDGIKSRLRHGGGNGKRGKAAVSSSSSPTAAGYDKVEKTDSMRVEIRSRQARKLIAKNLDAADSIARAGRANKRFFLAF